jgi:hypothetical protein
LFCGRRMNSSAEVCLSTKTPRLTDSHSVGEMAVFLSGLWDFLLS